MSHDPRDWVTILFVPADRPEMLAKAQARGADAILVDLEDAIHPAFKSAARETLAHALATGTLRGAGAVCVRVNAVDEGASEDLQALQGLRLDGIVLPKATGPAAVERIRAKIDRLLDDGARVALIPQVESAFGLVSLRELSAVAGIGAIALGGEDLCVDLGVARSVDSAELQVPRALLALHARAAGLGAIDTVYTAIDDEDGLVREAIRARQLGLSGKLLIHPRQIEPVRRVFGPSEAEVDWARRVLAGETPTASTAVVTQARRAADGAEGRAIAGVRVVDGRMVDAPVIAQARRIIARAR